ncbi:MAG: hypothetical protein AB8B83_04085 [Bdellovibrionales bacterium]
MLRSFLWPLLMLPIITLASSLTGGDSLDGSTLLLNFMRLVFTFAISLTLIYVIAKKTDRLKYFYQYVTVSNWFEIAMFVLLLPILAVLFTGGLYEIVQNYTIFLTCLGVVYTGFILTHAFRVPWEFASLMAISLLFIQETGFDFIVYVAEKF